MMENSKHVQKLIRYSLLLALSVILHYLESLIPIPFMFPGVKLGLANAVGLLVLAFWGEKDFFAFGILRVLLVAILRSGFGTAFLLSLSGTLLSTIFVTFFYRFTKASILSLSIIGSLFHGLGQILMVCLIYSNIYMITYLPILMIANFIVGLLLSFLVKSLLERLPSSLYNENNEVKE